MVGHAALACRRCLPVYQYAHRDLHPDAESPIRRALTFTTPRAVQEHLRGKQYTGWTRIRAKFKELEGKYKHLRSGPPPPGRYGGGADDYSRRPTSRERDYEGGYSRSGDHGGDRRHERYSERDSRYDSRGGYGRDRGSDRHSERDRYDDRGGRDRYSERDRYSDRRSGGSRGYDDRSVRRISHDCSCVRV